MARLWALRLLVLSGRAPTGPCRSHPGRPAGRGGRRDAGSPRQGRPARPGVTVTVTVTTASHRDRGHTASHRDRAAVGAQPGRVRVRGSGSEARPAARLRQ